MFQYYLVTVRLLNFPLTELSTKEINLVITAYVNYGKVALKSDLSYDIGTLFLQFPSSGGYCATSRLSDARQSYFAPQ